MSNASFNDSAIVFYESFNGIIFVLNLISIKPMLLIDSILAETFA